MNKINLLFKSDENYERWRTKQDNWLHTITDINITDIVLFLEESDAEFPSQFLYKPCINVSDAEYRLEIMSELFANEKLLIAATDLKNKLRTLLKLLNEYYEEKNSIQKKYRYLRIVREYSSCITTVKEEFTGVCSSGFKSLLDYSSRISVNEEAISLFSEIEEMLNNNILLIDSSTKTYDIEKCDGSMNESEILKAGIFDIFGITVYMDYSIVDPAPFGNMESKLLDVFCEKYPDIFIRLNKFSDARVDVLHDIHSFTDIYHHLLFYIVYIDFLKRLSYNGINVCMPVFRDDYTAEKCAYAPLAVKLIQNKEPLNTIVTNDVDLPKRSMFLLSGPNQGGKTVYLKSVGSTAYLAKCGCFVPCERCSVPFYDIIHTHFIQKEVFEKGRLVEEIERMEKIINASQSDSLILLNESFTTTRRKNGVEIALYYIKKIDEIGCSAGFVSHYYDIPDLYVGGNINIISLSSGIDKGGIRTYKISPKSGTGIAYARDIAYKCGMVYEQIAEALEKNKTEVLNSEKH